MKNRDWRADIHMIDDLNDVDQVEMMVFLRHSYLVCAKDLCFGQADVEFGHAAVKVVEGLQMALDAIPCPYDDGRDPMLMLEPDKFECC